MMFNPVIVDDAMSVYGLRRLHLVMALPTLPATRLAQEWDAFKESFLCGLAGIENVPDSLENIQASLEYDEEELGMRHWRIYWRPKMEAMTVFRINGDLVKAIGQAAARHHERVGVWPDRAVVRTGYELTLAGIELRDEKGVVGVIEVATDRWMLPGEVGVYQGGEHE